MMSQNIYELMSDEGKEHCRRIDKVKEGERERLGVGYR